MALERERGLHPDRLAQACPLPGADSHLAIALENDCMTGPHAQIHHALRIEFQPEAALGQIQAAGPGQHGHRPFGIQKVTRDTQRGASGEQSQDRILHSPVEPPELGALQSKLGVGIEHCGAAVGQGQKHPRAVVRAQPRALIQLHVRRELLPGGRRGLLVQHRALDDLRAGSRRLTDHAQQLHDAARHENHAGHEYGGRQQQGRPGQRLRAPMGVDLLDRRLGIVFGLELHQTTLRAHAETPELPQGQHPVGIHRIHVGTRGTFPKAGQQGLQIGAPPFRHNFDAATIV